SNVNFVAGQTIANAVTVDLSEDGEVCVYTSVGTHLVIDVNGAQSASAGSARFVAVQPTRLADTREAGVQLTAGVPYPVAIAGAGVPAEVTAALLNLTVVEPAAAGYVTAYPCGDAIPYVSNVNYVAARVIANSATVKVGEQGQVCVVSSADTHLVVD